MEQYAIEILLGLGVGFISAMPLGPVNLLVVQNTVAHGIRAGLAAVIGAVLIEFIYCFLAFAGIDFLFGNIGANTQGQAQLAVQLVAIPLMAYLGIVQWRKALAPEAPAIQGSIISSRSSLYSKGLFLGASLNLMNPVLISYWFGVAAYLSSHHWVGATMAHYLVFSVAVSGGALGFMGLVAMIAQRSSRGITGRTRQIIHRVLALLYWGFALWLLVKLVA
jgi:threonine/homoserine/homoserine lactone efflux protein